MGSTKVVQAPPPPPAPMPAAPPPPVAARPIQFADRPTRTVSQSGLGKAPKSQSGLLSQKPKRRKLGGGAKLY